MATQPNQATAVTQAPAATQAVANPHPGFVTLKEAAILIGRSSARTRQYVHDEKLGIQGEGWIRDEWGHILVSEASCASFVPPARGNARATGVKASTQLRHAKATRKLILERFEESDARAITLKVVNDLISTLAGKAAEQKATADAEAKAEAGQPSQPKASTPTTQLGQKLAAAGQAQRAQTAQTAQAAQAAQASATDTDDFSLDDIEDTPLGQ